MYTSSDSDQRLTLPSSRTILKGLKWFIIFTVIGTGTILWWKRPTSASILQGNLDWVFAGLIIPLVAVDYLLGGLRFRLFFDGKILPFISIWDCMRSNWANLFMSVVTPFNTGGGPAQLYILWRKGAKIADSLLVSMINFIATLCFLLMASMAALLLLPDDLFGVKLERLIQISFVLIFGLSFIMIMVMVFPGICTTLIEHLFRLVPIRSKTAESFKTKVLDILKGEALRFGTNFALIRRDKKGILILNLIITIWLYFNKFLIGYLIARALMQLVPFGIFIGLEILNYFVVLLAPTPGASGIAELSSVWVMERVISGEVLFLFATLWRFFTVFIAACIGGAVLFFEVPGNLKSILPAGEKRKDQKNPGIA